MRILVIGYGSIAKKHILGLGRIDTNFEIFALRHTAPADSIAGVQNIYSWEELPKDLTFVLISNPTSEHFNTIIKASELGIPLFIEKPPISKLSDKQHVLATVNKNKNITYCAFSLRFHPVIQWLKNNISVSDIIELSAYCGSYLPDWRPNVDYRKMYSAIKELGGGVHLDLIHELDYVYWLLGEPIEYSGSVSQLSDLEINVPDYANYQLKYAHSIATIQLNYYRKNPKRTIEIVLKNEELFVDLINNKVIDSNKNILFEAENDLIGLYENQMRYFISCIKEGKQPMNSLKEAIETLEIALNVKSV